MYLNLQIGQSISFVVPYGSFICTLLNAKAHNAHVHAKFQVIFQDCMNIKQNYQALATLFNMTCVETKEVKLLERVFYISGPEDENTTFFEITWFISELQKFRHCKFCNMLYKKETAAFCPSCVVKDKSASTIQHAYWLCSNDPHFRICKERLKREWEELSEETSFYEGAWRQAVV